MKKITYITILSFSIMLSPQWAYGTELRESLEEASHIELSEEARKDLAFGIVRALADNKNEIMLGTATVSTAYLIAAISKYSDIRTLERLMIRGTSFFPASFNTVRLVKWTQSAAIRTFLSAFTLALLGLELLFIPTNVSAGDTMEAYYLSEDGIQELQSMSDANLRETINFYPYLRDGLILKLQRQLERNPI